MRNNIMKFEKYKLFESDKYEIDDLKEVLYKGIEKSNIQIEKVIADNYDTNLSDIDTINADKHIFRLNIWNNITFVIAYSEDEFNTIKENINKHLTNYLSTKKIELINDISINLSDIISGDKSYNKIEKILTEDLIKDIITKLLGAYKFEKKTNGYYLWEFKE